MAVGLDQDTESLQRGSIPSGGAGTLSDGAFANMGVLVWVYRPTSGNSYGLTADGHIIHLQAGAREVKVGFDNTFGSGTASDPLLQALFNSGGGSGAVQTFVGANFLDEWVAYFYYEASATQHIGYIRLSAPNTVVKISRANDNAGSQYANTLTFGNNAGSSTATLGRYAYGRAKYASGLTDSDMIAWAASTAPLSGDWGFWDLSNNTDNADSSGNGRDLTFNGTLTSESDPPLAGPPPSITVQPVDQTVNNGATANFSVTATDATSYQWKKNGVSISGATSSTVGITASYADQGAQITVDCINSSGTTTSSAATLRVEWNTIGVGRRVRSALGMGALGKAPILTTARRTLTGGGGVQDLAGAAAGVASAAAALELLKGLAAAATAQATASANLSLGVPLSGSAQAVATATAALTTAINMAGAAAAQASATGQLSISVPLAGAMAALSTAGGTLSLNITLAAAAAAQAQASGTLSTQGVVDLQGAAAGQASAAGALSLSVSLLGAALGVATAAGSLSKSVALQGAAAGQSTAAAALSLGIPLSGAAQGVASATGALTASSGLVGAAVAVATAAGALSLSVALQGAALAQANASGSLSLAVGLVGSAAGLANAAGTLFLTIPLAGAAAGVASAAGGLVVTVQLAGAAAAQASAGGSLTVPVLLSGAAGGQALATGDLFVAGLGAATATAYKARRAVRAWRGRQPFPRSWRAPSPARLWVARGTPT